MFENKYGYNNLNVSMADGNSSYGKFGQEHFEGSVENISTWGLLSVAKFTSSTWKSISKVSHLYIFHFTPFRGSQGSLAGSSELDQTFTSERDGEWGRGGRCQVRWASGRPTLHCSLIVNRAVTTEISHTVILYVSSSLRLDTGGYLDTDDLIFSDRFSPEVRSCFSQMLVQEKVCLSTPSSSNYVLNNKIE